MLIKPFACTKIIVYAKQEIEHFVALSFAHCFAGQYHIDCAGSG